MGLFLCECCGKHWNPEHLCKPEDIEQYIREMDYRARMAELNLDKIRYAVRLMLQEIPSLDGEEVTIKTAWLRKLWNAAELTVDDSKTIDNFLARNLAMSRLLCEAFDMWRSRKKETTLQKLKSLRTVCDNAKEVFGYHDSVFDMSPEQVHESVPPSAPSD